MLRIVVVGLTHQTAPVEIRERFSFNKASLQSGLERLQSKANVEECAILSTCNRVEVYAVSSDTEACAEDITAFLSEYHDVPPEQFAPYLNVMNGGTAVKHLFRVSSSLDSMVLGEPQILGQTKEAYSAAQSAGTTGLILNRLFHMAFFIAKKVRYNTKIGSQAVSVSYVAVELAKRIFDDLEERTTLLIGTGDMGELTAKHLISAGIKDLVIASRTFESARTLASELKGTPIKIEEVHYYLSKVDILITATGSSDFIIKRNHVTDALKLRRNEPMFMIDIAVPRDIDPRVGEIGNVYLYDIDDLNGVLDDNLKIRRKYAEIAEEIAEQGVKYYETWLDGLKVVPTIISLQQKFESIKTSEVEKALAKMDTLSEREKEIIEAMASGIIGKILHSPLTKLKRKASKSLGALYSNTVNELFELDTHFDFLEEEQEEDNEASA
ncbi:MAG: glutamyl-tRNA reductase [Thermodesulfobacteriota bacterium]